ncbi:hypothetical protein HDU77_002328 [Chytriomyces hyalinus]|nr:hypothetical protein HDU77_002328 [Chytriomyces hyalinus]
MPRIFSDVISDPIFTVSLVAFCCFQVVFYHGLIYLYPKSFATTKQRGWILTALNSLVSVAVSIPYNLSFSGKVLLPEQAFQSWTQTTTIFCAFFMSYLIGDLVLGTLCYPSQMNPWTGYFHHTLYLILIPLSMTIDLAGNFVWMCILELPTLILAVAQIDKSLRSDLLFGASYFTTRIVLHVFAIYQFYIGYRDIVHLLIPVGIFPLHAMWFRQWCRQQLRLRRKEQPTASPTDDSRATQEIQKQISEAVDDLARRTRDQASQKSYSADNHKDVAAVFLGKKGHGSHAGRLRAAMGKRASSLKN